MKKLIQSLKGSLDITGIVVDVVLLVALIPVVVGLIATVEESATGTVTLTSEVVILGLTTLFLVMAFVFAVVKQSGLISKK